MKKNGPLLRDSITEEENAAAHWPFFLLPFLFSSRCQSLGMLNIRAGMVPNKHNSVNTLDFFSLPQLALEKMKANATLSLVIMTCVMRFM